jgi:MoxR-like ATPase
VFRGGPVRIAERRPGKERAEEGRVTTYDDRASLTDLTATVERVRSSVEEVIEGKPEVVRLSLTVLLAEGHLLIEDVPGVGKTMLAKALARSIDCSVRRIQFTPDLLPSDITGVSIWDQQRGTSSSNRVRSSRRS